MNREYLELLKKQAEKKFGRKILSSSDCIALSNEIYTVTNFKISVNTLRRLFNLMKCQYQPSLYTLDLLSRYCSFGSYSEFISNKPYAKNHGYSPLEANLISVVTSIINTLQASDDPELAYKNLVIDIHSKLSGWPDLQNYFQQHIVKAHAIVKNIYEVNAIDEMRHKVKNSNSINHQ